MKILVLYTRLTGYWMACMRNDRKRTGNEYLVIRKKPSENAPFKLKSEEGIKIFDGDGLSLNELKLLATDFSPDLIYVSGWTDKRYLSLAKEYRSESLPVILGMDNHWVGSIRQYTASLTAPIFLKKYYSHIWIPGSPQYYFARKLGFSGREILTGLYCADENNFEDNFPSKFEKQITFVGRLVEHKGVKNLCYALETLIESNQLLFNVHFIGNGPLEKFIPNHSKIIHTPFVHPDELPGKLKNAGFFILPSLYEAWGVVVHEAVLSGLPVISTFQTGAASEFLRNGYNGYLYDANNQDALLQTLKMLNTLSEKQYFQFANNSKKLSQKINLDFWSATINSIV